MDQILDYFPEIDQNQLDQFEALLPIYKDWNQSINVISRKDIENLTIHHILHSLSIAQFIRFKKGSQVIDLGTGGGFPGIPLAIFFPEVKFHLIDGTRKKLKVVEEVVSELKLKNVNVVHSRAEEFKVKADFVVSRAVARLSKLLLWSKPLISNKQINVIPNGMISLKGGNLSEEIKEVRKGNYIDQIPISDFFEEEYFEKKSLIYIQV